MPLLAIFIKIMLYNFMWKINKEIYLILEIVYKWKYTQFKHIIIFYLKINNILHIKILKNKNLLNNIYIIII